MKDILELNEDYYLVPRENNTFTVHNYYILSKYLCFFQNKYIKHNNLEYLILSRTNGIYYVELI